MGLDLLQFRTYIIRPSLTSIGLWCESAENLLLGTAMVESRLEYLHQKQGVAVSVMQIEPATYKSLRKTLMEEYSKLHILIKGALFMDLLPLEADYLHGNLSAAVMFARLKYYFNSNPLPAATDYEALAKYHKKIYNTSLGVTDVEKSKFIFRAALTNTIYPY